MTGECIRCRDLGAFKKVIPIRVEVPSLSEEGRVLVDVKQLPEIRRFTS